MPYRKCPKCTYEEVWGSPGERVHCAACGHDWVIRKSKKLDKTADDWELTPSQKEILELLSYYDWAIDNQQFSAGGTLFITARNQAPDFINRVSYLLAVGRKGKVEFTRFVPMLEPKKEKGKSSFLSWIKMDTDKR